ncbi:MAG: two-component system response regulator [Bacteroidetes bacterium]|jgi:CheY-like chemotaxis protein|nr:two-component system response regulator [Bacteroidota bacterium]
MTINAVEILLVEDNVDDAGLVIRSLQKNNLANHLVHLTDGAQALDFIFARGAYEGRNMEDGPKVILLDLKMPKVDGLQVLRAIKEDSRTCSIPVVIMTSSKEDRDIIESYKLGVNSYVVKPVGFENFAKAVAELGFYWILLNQPKR